MFFDYFLYFYEFYFILRILACQQNISPWFRHKRDNQGGHIPYYQDSFLKKF